MSALCLAAWIIAALKSSRVLPMSLPLKRKNGPKALPKLPVLAKAFSPRNPVHEQEMARVAEEASGLPASMGWPVCPAAQFSRRCHAYYNAAVSNLHNASLDPVENSAAFAGHTAKTRLLKADGGATSFGESRKNPVQSILSGPSASVMGALCPMAGWRLRLLSFAGHGRHHNGYSHCRRWFSRA